MSEITPANAVETAKRILWGSKTPVPGALLISALVARVEQIEQCRDTAVAMLIEEARARIEELEEQRDAAVAILRDALEFPDYVDDGMKLYMPDVINNTLLVLGAEETT